MKDLQEIQKKGVMAIRPYLNGVQNMGLENYELAIHEGTKQTESVTCLEKGGLKRYVTGLDETAPEVLAIKDPETRAARVKNIREIVAYIENILEQNVIDIEDPFFWDKVKTLKPNNSKFWDTVEISCENNPIFLNPQDDVHDLIKLKAIEAGGFGIIAKSYDDAKAATVSPKFYLDYQMDTLKTKLESKKLKNKALALLDELYYKDATKLFYVCKVTDGLSHVYKKRTPLDILYGNMDSYINGESFEKKIEKAAQVFITNCDYSLQVLKLKSICRDATFYRFVHTKSDGIIYHTATDSIMGRNQEEMVEFLGNPLNADIMDKLMASVEKTWNE